MTGQRNKNQVLVWMDEVALFVLINAPCSLNTGLAGILFSFCLSLARESSLRTCTSSHETAALSFDTVKVTHWVSVQSRESPESSGFVHQQGLMALSDYQQLLIVLSSFDRELYENQAKCP